MLLREFREQVQRVFADGLGITFVPGRLEGPNQTREWRGSCYLARAQEDPQRVAEQNVFVVLRVYAPIGSQGTLSPNVPADPSRLEDMADRLLMVAAANQSGLAAWFQRVVSIEIDPVTQGIEARLLAYSSNPASPGLETQPA